MKSIYRTVATAMAGFFAVVSLAAANTAWPPSQITIILPHEVGSSQNAQTRLLGDIWSKKLGTEFKYVNKAGASGRVGYDHFVEQKKDGSYLLSTNLASGAIMYRQQKPDWDYDKEILAMGVFGIDPGVVFVRKDSPYKTINDVIAAAKEKELSIAIAFWQSLETMQLHQVMQQTGAKFRIIPNKDSGTLVTQVMGGHLDVGMAKIGAVVRGGSDLRVIAVTMPDNPIGYMTDNAPTMDGALGFQTLPIASYRGIAAQKEWADKNPEHFKKLISTFEESLKEPELIKGMAQLGIDKELIVNYTPEQIKKEMVEPSWAAYDKFGSIYNTKQ